jgi:hypothetical protein
MVIRYIASMSKATYNNATEVPTLGEEEIVITRTLDTNVSHSD